MHDDNLKPPQPRAINRTVGEPVDPWHDWQPQWHMRDKAQSITPHIRQEALAPTEPVQLRDRGGSREASCRRRIVDARLWDGLNPVLQDAALEIAAAYESLGRGMGLSVSNWQRVPGARGQAAGVDQGRLTGAYMDWARACTPAQISHSMVIDILCYGISCAALDRDRRVRRGMARANLEQGLQLYAQMRGWLRGRRTPPVF